VKEGEGSEERGGKGKGEKGRRRECTASFEEFPPSLNTLCVE